MYYNRLLTLVVIAALSGIGDAEDINIAKGMEEIKKYVQQRMNDADMQCGDGKECLYAMAAHLLNELQNKFLSPSERGTIGFVVFAQKSVSLLSHGAVHAEDVGEVTATFNGIVVSVVRVPTFRSVAVSPVVDLRRKALEDEIAFYLCKSSSDQIAHYLAYATDAPYLSVSRQPKDCDQFGAGALGSNQRVIVVDFAESWKHGMIGVHPACLIGCVIAKLAV